MWLLPPQYNWIATIQALGFVLVGFFLVSIYQNRAKRF
ncbi:putative membrane protein [Acinetobacter baumannii 118362]|nr:putative membrane protein [Acinetobacter baumannii 118362]